VRSSSRCQTRGVFATSGAHSAPRRIATIANAIKRACRRGRRFLRHDLAGKRIILGRGSAIEHHLAGQDRFSSKSNLG